MIIVKNGRVPFLFFLLFILWQSCVALPDVIRIGGLFDTEDNEQELAFEIATEVVNSRENLIGSSRLRSEKRRLQSDDSYAATKIFCDLLGIGIAAVFGPQSQQTSLHIRSICDALEVPHVLFRWEYQLQRDDLSVNLYPHPSATSQAFLQLISVLGWKEFLYVYDEHQGAIRLQDFFFEAEAKEYKMKVFQFTDTDFRKVFWDMKKALSSTADRDSIHHRIILDVNRQNLYDVLKAAQQVGMMTENQAYVITCLDLHATDLQDFQFSKVRMTALRLVNENNPEFKLLLDEVNKRLSYRRNQPILRTLRTESVLIYDAVNLFAKALKEMDEAKEVDAFPPIQCNSNNKGTDGTSLINYMKSIKELVGLTGKIKFDVEGYRSELTFDVIHLTEEGLKKIGTIPAENANGSLNISTQFAEFEHKTYKVTTKLNKPYMLLKNSSSPLAGNDKYEGYGFDLLTELTKILHFNFKIHVVTHGGYGILNEETGEWSGMIREIQDEVADMAIADLTINSQREDAVDFTMPFINTGISILYKKSTQTESSLFTFLLPFSGEVWIIVMGAYLAVSMILFVIGRLSPYEWSNPHPCRQNDQVEENCFSMLNSMWFTIGSFMQQGSDVAPVASSTRTVASIWYFFNLIMISSYTANLAAFLTIENPVKPFESAEDLANQVKIKYGCIKSGSTRGFFEKSTIPTYQKMWKFMYKHKDEVLLEDFEEAKAKVLKGNYAFFTEAASIEYNIERECDLTQIGGLLDNKAYGIAVKKNNTKLSEWLSGGILKLQEGGKLHELKERWWKEKHGGGKCTQTAKSSSVTELGLANVGGVFVVMVLGLVLAMVVAVLEFLWYSRRIEKKEDEPLFKMLLKEFKFAVSCGDSEKPAPRLRKKKSASRD